MSAYVCVWEVADNSISEITSLAEAKRVKQISVAWTLHILFLRLEWKPSSFFAR